MGLSTALGFWPLVLGEVLAYCFNLDLALLGMDGSVVVLLPTFSRGSSQQRLLHVVCSFVFPSLLCMYIEATPHGLQILNSPIAAQLQGGLDII